MQVGDDSSFDEEGSQNNLRTLNDRLRILTNENKALTERNKELEDKLVNQREEFLEISRTNQRLQTKNQGLEMKVESLESKVKALNEEMQTGSSFIKKRDLEIADLKARIRANESLGLKHRQDFITYLAEKKKLSDQNLQLQAHIKDLDTAIQDLMQQNQQISKSLSNAQEQNRQLQIEIDQEQRMVMILEQKVSKARNLDKTLSQTQQRDLGSMQSLADVQKQLIISRNQVKELQIKCEKLQQFEEKAAKLEITVQQYRKHVQKLKKEIEDKEMELEPYRDRSERFVFQIDELREKNRITTEYAEKQIQMLNDEIIQQSKRIDEITNDNVNKEIEVENIKKENEELRNQITNYENGTIGLAEAAAQARQLKTLVSVRDAFIADLVNQINIFERIIVTIEPYLPPNFDFNAFYNEVLENQAHDIQRRTERKALEILQATLAQHKNKPISEVKIVVGGDGGKQRATVFSKPGGFSRTNTQEIDSDSYDEEESDYDYEEDSQDNEPSLADKVKGSKLMRVMSFTKDKPQQKTMNITEGQVTPRKGDGQAKKQTKTKAVQTDPVESFDPYEHPPFSKEDMDEWARTLQEKYIELKELLRRLKSENNQLKEQNDLYSKQNADLTLKNSDLNQELNALSKDQNNRNSGTQNINRTPKSAKLTQTEGLFLSLDISRPVFYSKFDTIGPLVVAGELAYPSDDLMFVLSQREIDENNLLDNLKQLNIKLSHDVDELKRQNNEKDNRIADLENLLKESQRTIELLQKKLEDQRAAFKEKFINLKNEADRYVEQRVKDALDLRAVQEQNGGHFGRDDLGDVALELKRKNAKIQELTDLLKDKDDAIRMAEAQRDAALKKLNETSQLFSESTTTVNDDKANPSTTAAEFNSELKLRYTKLQKKYNALLKEYNLLKKQKNEGTFSSTDKSSSNEDIFQKEMAKMKQIKARAVAAEQKNEELTLLLKKANQTIAQLNELLQRKEAKLDRLQEQVSQLKQQNTALIQKQ